VSIYADRSVTLAIAWARVAPRIGATFILPPGWEEDVGFLSLDNRVRDALGVSSDRAAEDRLLERIKARKAGTLVRLQIQVEQIRTAIELTDNQGISAGVKRAIFKALAAAIGTITLGSMTISSYALLELADLGRAALLRDYLDTTRAELDGRIARRADRAATETTSTDKPRAFGTKN
jgi:GT2 family glycosyltransferase